MSRITYDKISIKIFYSILCIIGTFILFINVILYGFTEKNYVSIIERKILTLAGIYTEEIKSVEINDLGYDSNIEGAWHIDKSAEWTGTNTAQVKFDLSTIMKTGDRKKDIIFVLDTSDSMSGEKIEKVKSDSIELVNYILSDVDNRVALINFGTKSTILSSFTNDKDTTISMIETLITLGCTNYNAGLQSVLTVLDGYEQEPDRDLIVLFLTDGYPNVDCPNQIATYAIIRDKYPFITVNGVQYEMGVNIIEDIKNISYNQYYADVDTLNNVLFEASIASELYENFEIVDYIDDNNFYVNSVDDINVSFGKVTLEEENGLQKITWNLGKNSFKTGDTATMLIDLVLKEQYVNQTGFYPTNKKETIISKLQEESEKINESKLTPVLQNNYSVVYDVNTPTGCTLDAVNSEDHFVYETVKKIDKSLVCDNYSFKGWEIVNEDVEEVNDDYFVMPSHDVIIRATWTSQNINKSVEGTVNEKITLYRTVRKDALSSSGIATTYTGNGSDDYSYKVYYYKGAVTKNNVLFAGFCWQMVRTTDTGGVKLIYNGVPSDAGTCSNTGKSSQLSTTSNYSSNYNSVAYSGYMYNKVYTQASKQMTSQTLNATYNYPVYRLSMNSTSNKYYVAKDYTISGGKYTLNNPEQLEAWSSIYGTVAGKGYYTCKLTTIGTCSILYYILGGDSGYAYTIALTVGQTIDEVNKDMVMSSEMIDNGDGTYSLSGTKTIIKKSDWYTNYSLYKNQYICSDYVSSTCSNMYYITETSNYNFDYVDVRNNYKYGNDVVYDSATDTYELIDTDISVIKQFYDYPGNYGTLGKNHYTCFNISGKCSSIYYIYYIGPTPYYVILNGGVKIEQALKEMLRADDVNTKNSTIKTVIDKWYADYMTSYTKYLEDTVYCNDRSISSLGGWNPSGNSLTDLLYFKNYDTSDIDLTCSSVTDSFTMSDTIGNGKLTYPVGLLTASEVYLAYKDTNSTNHYLNSGQFYWLASPYGYGFFNGYEGIRTYRVSSTSGFLGHNRVNISYGVRPVISLIPGIEYYNGTGEANDPYVIDISIEY